MHTSSKHRREGSATGGEVNKNQTNIQTCSYQVDKESVTFEYSDKENIIFGKGEKKQEGKGGKYLENKDIFLAKEKKNGEGKYISCGGKEKQRRKRKIFGEVKYIFCGGEGKGGKDLDKENSCLKRRGWIGGRVDGNRRLYQSTLRT